MNSGTKKRVIGKINKFILLSILLGCCEYACVLNGSGSAYLIFFLLNFYQCYFATTLIEQPNTHIVKKCTFYFFKIGMYLNVLGWVLTIVTWTK